MAGTRTSVVRTGRAFGSKRAVDWAIMLQNTSYTVLAAGVSVNLGGGLALSTLTNAPFTIVRMRGLLSIASDQNAATENQVGALGVTIVGLKAAASGIAALPHPKADPFADWMLYQSFKGQFVFDSAVAWQAVAVQNFELDSKAMRKIDAPSETSLAAIIENDGTHGIGHSLDLRILVKFT